MASQADWDKYFMDIADVVAKRSKDPSSQNGCVIVDRRQRPISFGYNGTIQGSDESLLVLSERPMKYRIAIHSEMNAVLFAGRDLEGCTLYNKMATCDNCLKHCLQAGIKRFVYKQLRVNSYIEGSAQTMTNLEADEAIVRMLLAVPEVETLNMSNGKTYIEDLLADYEEGSAEQQRLLRWVKK